MSEELKQDDAPTDPENWKPMARKLSRAERRAARAQKRAALVVKQQNALRLKLAGATFEDIAIQLGYVNKSGAYKAYLAALHAPGHESRAEGRRLQKARLERLLLTWWPRAIAGDQAATDRVLTIIAAERALEALDLPRTHKLEHTGEDGGPIEHKDAKAPDLSRLSDDELRQLEAILDRLHGGPGPAPSAMGDEPADAAGLVSDGGGTPPQGQGGEVVI